MESTDFSYNGISSSTMKLKMINFNTSFVETPLWGESEIQETRTSEKLKSYFYKINRQPIEFTASFVLVDINGQPAEWTAAERKRIASYFIVNGYKEFITNDDITKKYYAICKNPGVINLISGKGYIELNFQTNSPFAWTEEYTNTYDFSSSPGINYISYENKSNIGGFFYPKLEVDLTSSITAFNIINVSNGNKTMSFTGLLDGEKISIVNENKIILSETALSYPFSKFNGIWIELVQGFNNLGIEGRGIYTM